MATSAVVAGTSFYNPKIVGTTGCMAGDSATLVREPENKHDRNAVAVFITKSTLGFRRSVQIGYLKAPLAKRLAPKMDAGVHFNAVITSIWNPEGREFPRVSLSISVADG